MFKTQRAIKLLLIAFDGRQKNAGRHPARAALGGLEAIAPFRGPAGIFRGDVRSAQRLWVASRLGDVGIFVINRYNADAMLAELV
jgi:hypothetical protein